MHEGCVQKDACMKDACMHDACMITALVIPLLIKSEMKMITIGSCKWSLKQLISSTGVFILKLQKWGEMTYYFITMLLVDLILKM